jgi:PAS domain S-box-containing protein
MTDPIRILLIEDDTVDQLAFKRHLEREKLPYHYEVVQSMKDALAALKRQVFDIIVSDYNLGDGTALDVCEAAKGIPLIVITGAGNEEIAVKALKSGAYDYIIKDADRNYLKVLPLTVEKAVQSNRADKQVKMLMHAVMHINDSVYITDTQGIIRFVNQAFHHTYGFSAEEVIGKPVSVLGEECQGGECIQRRKDGSTFYVSLSKSIVRDDSGEVAGVVAVARDITERKAAEEALRASEEKYRLFFDEDLAGAFIATPDGKLLDCNPSFARIFGFASVEEALRYNLIALYPKSRLFAEVRDLVTLNCKLEHYEIQLRRIDGSPVHIIQNVIGKFDAHGTLVEIKGYVFDNTRHKMLEEQLRQAQKMESIGTLAGGIAHDFNNILAIIMGHAQILMRGDHELIEKARSVETINRAAQRGSKLVEQILTFARRNEVVFESVNLNHVIEDLHKMLSETFPRTIDFVLKLDPALPTTVADQSQIHQAILNLCVNSRDAMPNGGTLTIESKLVRGLFLRERHPDAHEHLYACIRVSDTGTGMPPETLSRMFEPFFTTKEIGKGTGLGLAVVYGVTKSHKGFVDVESQLGVGTTFSVYFPIRREESVVEANADDTNSDRQQEKGTVLVVEDEEMLLNLVKDLLGSRGYTVLTATDGLQAVETYAQHRDRIDVVLIDLGLPKIDGWEAFQRMREVNPHVKVIFASGYIDQMLRENLMNGGALDLVQKPYMPDEIVNRVREVLAVDVEALQN